MNVPTIMNRFTPEQSAWLEALESGKFRKAYETLCHRDECGNKGYCCLGVGAVVLKDLHPEAVKLKWEENSDGYLLINGYSHTCLGRIGGSLLFLVSGEGAFKPSFSSSWRPLFSEFNGTSVTSLTELNDNLRWSHRKIAEFIRKYPHFVFNNFSKAPKKK